MLIARLPQLARLTIRSSTPLACASRLFVPHPQYTTNRGRAAMAIERLADKLEAPELDDRSYRVIRLPNKLEALLVHDPDTDKASASVNVNVGSFSDAEDMPGMAHAVEHLLFMGTEKVSIRTLLKIEGMLIVLFYSIL